MYDTSWVKVPSTHVRQGFSQPMPQCSIGEVIFPNVVVHGGHVVVKPQCSLPHHFPQADTATEGACLLCYRGGGACAVVSMELYRGANSTFMSASAWENSRVGRLKPPPLTLYLWTKSGPGALGHISSLRLFVTPVHTLDNYLNSIKQRTINLLVNKDLGVLPLSRSIFLGQTSLEALEGHPIPAHAWLTVSLTFLFLCLYCVVLCRMCSKV